MTDDLRQELLARLTVVLGALHTGDREQAEQAVLDALDLALTLPETPADGESKRR